MDPECRIPLPTGSIADVDRDITSLQNSLSLYPRFHSYHVKCIRRLANMRLERYKLSQEKEDLDKFILHCTEAILLPPVPRKEHRIFRLLYKLARCLLERSHKFGQPEGVKHSIEYFRYLRRFHLDSFIICREDVTRLLVKALGTHVKLGIEDGTRVIKEIVVLCNELLTFSSSTVFPTNAFESLRDAANTIFRHGEFPTHLIDEVVGCLRDAAKVFPPGSYLVLFTLAEQLHRRFIKTHSLDDYEEAITILEKLLDPNQPGGCPCSIRVEASRLATELPLSGFAIFRTPEYSEAAISRLRAELSSPSIDDDRRIQLTDLLSSFVGNRFRDYGLSEGLEEANSNILLSEPKDAREKYPLTALQQKIHDLEKLLSNTPGTGHFEEYLDLAGWYESKFELTNDISDIEESINYYRLSLRAIPTSDMWRRQVYLLTYLHHVLYSAFEKTSKISYLNESITICYDILDSNNWHNFHFTTVYSLSSCLFSRGQLLGQIVENHHEAIRLILMVIDDQHAPETDRFELSCVWTGLARSINHPTTMTAYKTAMSFLQKFLSFAPTVLLQHTRLVAISELCRTMPLDYASYQIELGWFEEAVETLEQGRALIWSEMRGLRTPVAKLIQEDSSLAKRFAEVNQELEALTISIAPSGRPEIKDGVAQGRDGTDPFGYLLIMRKKLVDERDALISRIQNLPGLEGFLRAPSFATLRSAASSGPVIIINHCKLRSDIVIIFHNYLLCTIPTPQCFFDHGNELRDELTKARSCGLDSKEYQDALCSVLKGLYELVGEPVITKLRLLGVPEQSRIWWCPTSVFCSLPLHAMGPIPPSGTCKRYFSDLYIPSYTPSLSALIESRTASPQVLEKPSLLLVAQPDDNLPGVTGEIKVIQERAHKARVAVMGLVSSKATPSPVLDSLRGSRFAHFACHGVLETGKPFEASFKLHGGSRLTLLDIVRSRLPDAEFAFLSCCHAAEITENSVSDEALHLTAAMQYCGFRSVVGTMWEMADTDGRDLARNFYKSLFSKQKSGVPFYERSAGALRDATQKLRQKRGISLERWVNFVHYGA